MKRDGNSRKEIAVGGAKLRVQVDGPADAPALVLSHMLGMDLSLWDDLVPVLAKRFRVVRYDTRGHGGSVADDGPLSIGRLGRDVLEMLDALGITTAHFCGLSLGGVIGLWLLAHAPARIGKAVIAGSAAKLGTPDTWNQRIAAALAEGMEPSVAQTMERWFSPAFADRAADTVDAVRDRLLACPPSGYAACCAALRDLDLREAVRGVATPVLVVRGSHDPSVTAEDAAHLVESMDGASLVELNSRHCCVLEAKAGFSDAVIRFLSEERASGRASKPVAAKTAGKTRSKTSVRADAAKRRGGGTGLSAARRPVTGAAPVSGKAVAKASATRKTAARSAPRATQTVPPRRRSGGASKRAPLQRGAITKTSGVQARRQAADQTAVQPAPAAAKIKKSIRLKSATPIVAAPLATSKRRVANKALRPGAKGRAGVAPTSEAKPAQSSHSFKASGARAVAAKPPASAVRKPRASTSKAPKDVRATRAGKNSSKAPGKAQPGRGSAGKKAEAKRLTASKPTLPTATTNKPSPARRAKGGPGPRAAGGARKPMGRRES